MNKKFFAVFLILLIFSPIVFASEIDDILEPITKIYDLIKNVVSVLGIIAITIAGALYMFSGSNIQSRENAKSMVSYAIVGLVLVWVAPMVVSYLTITPTPWKWIAMKKPIETCITILAITFLFFSLPVHADEEEPVVVNVDVNIPIDELITVVTEGITNILTTLTSIPEQGLSLVTNSFKNSASNINISMLSLIELLLTINPNPETLRPWWESIILIISSFYLLLFTIIGLMFLYYSMTPSKKAIAKEWLKNTFLMIIGVNTSLVLYKTLLELSSAITQFMWISGFENFFQETIFSNAGTIMIFAFGLSAFIALLTIFFRYVLLLVGTIAFPIGIFLYYIPPLQNWGKMIFNTIGILLFMQFIDVIIFVASNQTLTELGGETLAQTLVPTMAFIMIAGINTTLFLYAIIKSAFNATENSNILAFALGAISGQITTLIGTITKTNSGVKTWITLNVLALMFFLMI